MYVTERAVFRLTSDGMTLDEITPGIDLQTDVLDRMGFVPLMPRAMDAAFGALRIHDLRHTVAGHAVMPN